MIIGGLICIVSGSLYLGWMIKKPMPDDFTSAANLKGYGGSIGLIIVGVAMVIEGFNL